MSTSPPTTPAKRRNWLWPFEVIDQIGEGGMGVVYRARYVINGRIVALKMLPADVSDETVLARFEREVEVLKNLKHPNIVRCFGGACENDRRFYAMELVEGGTLEERLEKRGRLPWEQVVYYAIQMCAALECSHKQGVVHRDIKPSNFLVSKAGVIKLSDFGLASVEAARKITAAGKTAGTFQYMAPEQIRGQDVVPQTDLYALGCVLYELLTGQPPFVCDTPAGTLHQHCNAVAPRVCDTLPDCPIELDRIVAKLLRKEISRRYESAAELSIDLKRVAQSANGTPAPLPQKEKPSVDEAAVTAPPAPVKIADERRFYSRWMARALAIALLISLVCNVFTTGHAAKTTAWEKRWITASNNENLFVRQAAVKTLSELSVSSTDGREALAERLQDVDPDIRIQSIEGLQRAGGYSREYIPHLSKVQQFDSDVTVRSAAARAIAEIRNAPLQAPDLSFWAGMAAILIGAVIGVAYWMRLWKTLKLEAEAPHRK
ncbi:MAG: protein kinase [Planctomycetaceae bacterium]|nr:protein kinase [Planctomycetaceae bacterium]MCA9043250.1 protein kinase [Planctomycetaceae bacterium]